jgi:hypothetical protein
MRPFSMGIATIFEQRNIAYLYFLTLFSRIVDVFSNITFPSCDIVVLGDSMIDYIRRSEFGLLDVAKDQVIQIYDEPITRFLERLAHQKLSTLSGIIEGTKRALKIKSKPPLYFGVSLLLMQIQSIRSETAYLINYFAVARTVQLPGNEVLIYYKSGHVTKYRGYGTFLRQWESANRILRYLEELERI